MGLRVIKTTHVTSAVRRLCIEANTVLGEDVVTFGDLGPEDIRRMLAVSLPAAVVNDIYGSNLYEQGKRRYKVV